MGEHTIDLVVNVTKRETNMELRQIAEKIREAVERIETVGAKYAAAKGISYQMQKMREVILATEMKKVLGTNAHKEMEAKASKVYHEHLVATGIAIKEEQKWKSAFIRWQAEYESWRSFLSLEKAKMNLV